MADDSRAASAVERFILDYIDSVPHLEALLLVWGARARRWSIEELAKALYLPPRQAQAIAQDLTGAGFFVASQDGFSYASDSGERDRLITAVDEAYRRETARLSTLLHARGSRALRDFAHAFELKKRKE